MTREDKIEALKARIRAKLDAPRPKRVKPMTPPRYDEVFFKGLKWLDSLAFVGSGETE